MKIINNFIILFLFLTNNSFSESNDSFKQWLNKFRDYALENNISRLSDDHQKALEFENTLKS